MSDIDLVLTSCGFGLPMYEYTGERDIHFEWADKKGAYGLVEYMREKNHKKVLMPCRRNWACGFHEFMYFFIAYFKPKERKSK